MREKLLAMGAKVEEQIAKSMRSLTERDAELAEQVIDGDARSTGSRSTSTSCAGRSSRCASRRPPTCG